MNVSIYLRRKLKGLLLKLRLDLLLQPFENFLLLLVYMAQFARWRHRHAQLPFNDFYNASVKYDDRFKLHTHIFDTYIGSQAIDYLEFGVADGDSFSWWLKRNTNSNSRFFGFDTFTGLPEDFGVMKKSDYDRGGAFPDIHDSRAKFVAGLFQHSLPGFLAGYTRNNNRIVMHLDADLYSATWYVLSQFAYIFRPGDIILFDEFGVPLHEFKAFTEFCHAYAFQYEVLGAVNNYLQVAIRIPEPGAKK